MIVGVISRYGDRKREAPGLRIDKVGMNIYRVALEDGPRPYVFAETVTPYRAAVVDQIDARTFDIRTYNTLNGYHPGSDLRVRVYREGEPDLLGAAEIKGDRITNVDALGLLRSLNKEKNSARITFDDEGQQVLVQPQGKTFRYAEVKHEGGKVLVETLITRTPATPLETNIEIAVVRNLGPIRGR